MKITRTLCKLILHIAIKLHLLHPYQPIPELNIRVKKHREQSVLSRWEAIKKEIDMHQGSYLDVGCNVGFYVLEAEKLGYVAAGLDFPRHAYALSLAGLALGRNNVFSLPIRLNPENVVSLPEFDVIMALQVFHHFCRVYGMEGGIKIIDELWMKSKRSFIFETESSQTTRSEYGSNMPDMKDGSVEWAQEHFMKLGAKSVKEIYRDENRNRSIVLIQH